MMCTYAPEGQPVSAFGEGMPLKSQPCGRTPANSELPRMVLEAVEQQAADVDRLASCATIRASAGLSFIAR
eukprot:426630-Prymnesium_polylepis.1